MPINDNNSVKEVILKYENGINSKKLLSKFNDIDSYLITNIELENKLYKVKCEKFSDCINDIYNEESALFELKYNAAGFKIKSITYLIYE